MTQYLQRANALGVAGILTSGSTSTSGTSAGSYQPITIDQLIDAAQGQTTNQYIHNNLQRAKYLGTPGPIIPTITLKDFVEQLVNALAELFRAQGFERIADYLLSQHDLTAVFGQLATRILAMHQETANREALIEKYLRINAGAANLLTDNQVDLTTGDTSSLTNSMSQGQVNQVNSLLTGFTDATGYHAGLNSIVQNANASVFTTPLQDLQSQVASTEFLDPDNAQIDGGLTAAQNLISQMQSQATSGSANYSLIPNAQTNAQGVTNAATLLSTANSIQQSSYTQGGVQTAINQLQATSNSVASGAQPVYPPLYVAGQSYAVGAFVTLGYKVYQCTNNTAGSPSSDPNSWLDTGYYPTGGAYQLNSLTSAASKDVSYLTANGQTGYAQGSSYTSGQNVLYNGQAYNAISTLDVQHFTSGTLAANGVLQLSDGSLFTNKSSSPVNLVNLVSGATYKAGDWVYYSGQFYQAKTDGAYNPITSYALFNSTSAVTNGQFVSYNGQLYQATASAGTGNVAYTTTPLVQGANTGGGFTVGGLFNNGYTLDGAQYLINSSVPAGEVLTATNIYGNQVKYTGDMDAYYSVLSNTAGGYVYSRDYNAGLPLVSTYLSTSKQPNTTTYTQYGFKGTAFGDGTLSFNFKSINPTPGGGHSIDVLVAANAGQNPLSFGSEGLLFRVDDINTSDIKIYRTVDGQATLLGSIPLTSAQLHSNDGINLSSTFNGSQLQVNVTQPGGLNQSLSLNLDVPGSPWITSVPLQITASQYSDQYAADKSVGLLSFRPAPVTSINTVTLIPPDSSPIFKAVASSAMSLPPSDPNSNFFSVAGPSKIIDLTPGTSYNAGDVIRYNGTLYTATTAGTFNPTTPPAFNNITNYKIGDVISYGGNTYKVTGTPGPSSIFDIFGSGGPFTLGPQNIGIAASALSRYAVDPNEYITVTDTSGNQLPYLVGTVNTPTYGIGAFTGVILKPPDLSTNFQLLGSSLPATPGAGFTTFNLAQLTGTWAGYDLTKDTSRWSSGVSAALLSAQAELKTVLTALQSLFNTTSQVAGLRQDFLSICGTMPDDGSTPVIKTFSIPAATQLELQLYLNTLQGYANLASGSPPNLSAVAQAATQLKNRVDSQISSASLADGNQSWGAIDQALAQLIAQCNSNNQAGALATIGQMNAPLPGEYDPDSTTNTAPSLMDLFQNQYGLISVDEDGDYVDQNLTLTGQIDLSSSPYAGVIEDIQEFQALVARVNNRDTSVPAAQLFNLMKNKLEDIYDAQPLLNTPLFPAADFKAAQTLLGQAMLTRGGGGIAITLSLAQVEALDDSDPKKSTLLGLYRDMYLALGDTNNYNAVNNYIASKAPATPGPSSGYLANVSSDLTTLSTNAQNINTTTESTQQNKRNHIGTKTSRKFTNDTGYTSLKNQYDTLKGQITSMMSGINVDMTYAANQYIGDAYVAGQTYLNTQQVVYNGQLYKCNVKTADAPDAGAAKQPPTWELMVWNPNRGAQYVFGDVVNYNGQMYRCISAHSPSSTDQSLIPGTLTSSSTWQALTFQANHTYLPGDTVLVSQNGQYVPYVCQQQYYSTGAGDLGNAAYWTVGYNNAVQVNASGQAVAAATLSSMTAIVNGSSTQFVSGLTQAQLQAQLGTYNTTTGQYSKGGNAFTTLNNATNNATSATFLGWSDASEFLKAGTGGGTATNYDGMQFFNPFLSQATSVMSTLQQIDLFFYAHQLFTISGGGDNYTGFQSPMVALAWGQSDQGGANAYRVKTIGQSRTFDGKAALQVFGTIKDHNAGSGGNAAWASAQDKATINFYQASRALATQLKSAVTGFQNNFNSMMLQVQTETRRLLVSAFSNTTDIEASLKQLFRTAPLSDDEKKLLAKILAVVMSLLISILGSSPQIKAAFTQKTVTSTSKSGVKTTSTQWVFDDLLSTVRISEDFARNLIAKAVALAGELLSEQKRGGSVTADRLTTVNYLNMAAFAKGQEQALEKLDRENTLGQQFL